MFGRVRIPLGAQQTCVCILHMMGCCKDCSLPHLPFQLFDKLCDQLLWLPWHVKSRYTLLEVLLQYVDHDKACCQRRCLLFVRSVNM